MCKQKFVVIWLVFWLVKILDCENEAQVYCEECNKNFCMKCIEKVHSIFDHSSPLVSLNESEFEKVIKTKYN